MMDASGPGSEKWGSLSHSLEKVPQTGAIVYGGSSQSWHKRGARTTLMSK